MFSELKMDKELKERSDFYYKYQKDRVDEAVARLRRLEDKAIKLLTMISVIITVVTFILKYVWDAYVTNQLVDVAFVIIFIEIILMLISFMASWGHVLSSLWPEKIPILYSGKETEAFIMTDAKCSDIVDVQCSIGRRMSEDCIKFNILNERKAKMMLFAFEEVLIGSCFFVIFVISICFVQFSVKEVNTMSENNDLENTTPSQHDQNSAPPTDYNRVEFFDSVVGTESDKSYLNDISDLLKG